MTKYSDITQFIQCQGHRTDVPLRYLEDNIKRWESEGLQLNPDFQRGHVWTEQQQIAFVEFILKGGKSGLQIFFNHPGWMRDFKGDFVCVDGLQRLTACLRFLNNEIVAFGHFAKDYEDKIPFDIGLVFIVNNLKNKRQVLQWYLEMNTGGTVHTEDELSKVRAMLEK